MESKYRAARVLELLALGLSVCASWSRVLLKGVFSVHVAPTPEGRRSVLMIFCGLASGDSLLLEINDKRCNAAVGGAKKPCAFVVGCVVLRIILKSPSAVCFCAVTHSYPHAARALFKKKKSLANISFIINTVFLQTSKKLWMTFKLML